MGKQQQNKQVEEPYIGVQAAGLVRTGVGALYVVRETV
jgi:hypothetical protein